MRHPRVAFVYSVPIAALGGLIGLGGAEFRLPVLVGPLGYAARVAVPLNLSVSLVTIGASLITRLSTTTPDLSSVSATLLALTMSAVAGAFLGPGLASRLTDARLERTILILLVAIGLALIAESILPNVVGALVPFNLSIPFALVAGVAIGLVSSLLGVAGGELIIPTLVFGFGMDIKLAGTASLLVSLPTVLVGIVRYSRRGAYRSRTDLTETVAPMAVGSVIGALIGGLLVAYAPVALLKFGLGLILLVSAIRIFGNRRMGLPSTD